ncbi:hypothetical protein BGZ72_001106, partial [Mortierella alpina]
MDQSQSFRVIGTTQVVTIPVQQVGGENVVSWENIKQVFPGVKCVKNGDVEIPRCIKYFPGVVLDIVVSSAYKDVPAGLPTDLSFDGKYVEDLRVSSASAETLFSDTSAVSPPISPLIPPPSVPCKVELSKTALSFIEALKCASKKAKELDGHVPQQERNAEMAYMIKLLEASEVKQEELSQLQKQALNQQDEMKQLVLKHQEEIKRLAIEHQEEVKQLHRASDAKQEEVKQLQKQALDQQEEMKQLAHDHHEETKQMQQRALDQLSLLHSRVQAVLTQTYELHEYPIPRLFIVLPQYPSGWDILQPFTDKYRLYFLCECGEHTRAPSSNSKIPHEIHLAKHEGYEIARPTAFFQQYGPYVLTILKMLKFGVSVASVAVPAVAHLINADALDQAAKGLQHLRDCIKPGMDQVISKLEKDSVDEGEPFENCADQMENKEVLEGADLRKLETFLKDKDGNKVLGNLYRTVTDDGHVKWVCMDHYRENYKKMTTEAFRFVVYSVGGLFDENSGVVKVELRSRELADRFYTALEQARSVHELKIKLSWETTYGDFKKLRDTLSRTSVGILEFGYSGTGPASDYGNRNRRYNPIRQIMGHPSIQSFTIASIHDDFLQRCNLNAADIDFSNLKRLVIGGFESDACMDKFKLVLSHAPNVSSLSLVTPKTLFEVSSPWSSRARIFSDLTRMTISGEDSEDREDKVFIELDKGMKPSNNSSLLLEAPRDFLTTCYLWPADAEFSNLKRLTIKRFDLDAAILEFYMVYARTLMTLELPDNSIGNEGVKALAEALKTNSTLTTLDLGHNSIGDDGVKTLAEALKTNKTLTNLDLGHNSIGDDE